jgi:anti-sigma B factor antagonist
VLIGAHGGSSAAAALIVVCEHEAIVKTFRITGLDGVFTLVPILGDALDGDAVGG